VKIVRYHKNSFTASGKERSFGAQMRPLAPSNGSIFLAGSSLQKPSLVSIPTDQIISTRVGLQLSESDTESPEMSNT